jgi:lipopolysaccharide export system permease protein
MPYSLMPSRTIARYTVRLFLLRTIALLAGLVVVLQTLDLLGESSKILAVPGNSEVELWRYVLLRLPQLIAQFLPFSVLLGTLITLMQLNQNSEVVVFKAAGISAHQILAPLIAAAFGIAVVNFAFNELVLTRTNQRLIAWQNAEYHQVPEGSGARGDVWTEGGGDLLHAASIEGTGPATILRKVTIYERSGDSRLAEVIRAESARPVAGGWRLEGATRFDVASGRRTDEGTLHFPSTIGPERFVSVTVDPDRTPIWDLVPIVREWRAADRPIASLEAAMYHKVSGPLSAVLMPLLGSVAAFGLARSGRLFVRAVIGLLLGFAFFVADNFMLAMGDFGAVPPILAAWSPFLLFLLIGESVLIRTEE